MPKLPGKRLCVLAASLLGLASGTVHADVHKCINANGRVEYRDVPCGAGGKSVKVVKTPTGARIEDVPIYEEDSEESAPDPDDVTAAPAAPAPAVLAPP